MRPALLALAGAIAGGAAVCLAQAGAAPQFEPGLWEVTSTVTSAGVAGAPRVDRRCLSPAEAAKGVEAMLLGAAPDCSASRTAMAGGKLDALFHCAPGTRDAMTVAIKASFGPKIYDATSDIAGSGTAMSVHLAGKWIGACSN